MRSYAESREHVSFDWNAFLKQDKHTLNDLMDARKHARWWTTCACGAQCEIIPRNEIGAPIDDELRYLGEKFYLEISSMCQEFNKGQYGRPNDFINYKELAISLLHHIEKRAQILIYEIENKEEESNKG